MLKTPLMMKFSPTCGYGIKDADDNSVYDDMLVREFNALASHVIDIEGERNTFHDLWQECIAVQGACGECALKAVCEMRREVGILE